MTTKISALFIICFLTISAFAQTNLNTYKYVIVPNKFDFLKEADQYQLNSLTEFLFNKYGFSALMEGSDYPDDAVRNRCLVLKSNLLKDNSMFKTKVTVELKNCNDQVVFTSEIGESREKEYQRAYTEALRQAFESIEALNHSYEPGEASTDAVSQAASLPKMQPGTQRGLGNNSSSQDKEIQELRQQVQNLKKEKEAVVVEEVREPMEEVSDVSNKQISAKKVAATTTIKIKASTTNVLYAQAIENGFQLVDSTPKVVYKIKKTSIPDVYMVENKNATLSKNGDIWTMEYYENNVLKQEVLNIKF